MSSEKNQDNAALFERLRRLASSQGLLSYEQFVGAALYAPGCGYYVRELARVGLDRQADFYTAPQIKPVFARLIINAVTTLLNDDPGAYTFIELGAEPGSSLLENLAHPFAKTRVIRLGDPFDFEQKAIIFANELLDAQPFHRLQHSHGAWRELGVYIDDDALSEITLPTLSDPVTAITERLPKTAPENYVIDLPLGAESLLKKIVEQDWQGIFLTCDYGKHWQELIESCPEGTARAYHRHRNHNNLLERPREQDNTCHLCWDHLEQILSRHKFSNIQVERQEAFLVKNAADAVADIIAKNPEKFDPDRQSLQEIIHPAHMGHKFQVMAATRP